ncbi:hypothetical protein [Azospirillum picis]|uniref:Ribbon-helix-helix protein CopG domain-containing protein n=1 Tax=Azospirillum picis TaxID=488438 RepID=A0ABU0MU53_9PROT|nr:hypothetical protein [Azospirillum picis]MBP2300922.1 hypothetical protein [Azospirillum picis]MDQ0537026.1 hypothetical protein [Azospirillum picis]
MVGGYVDAALAKRFNAWARQTDGSVSAALRRLIIQAVEGREPAAPRGAGTGPQVGVRFKADERAALAAAATARGTSPANWLRSLALVHLARRPQWSPAELEALRAVFAELRAINAGLTRLAAQPGGTDSCGDAAQRAAAQVRGEMRRVVAVLTGNFDYWGLPDAERPTAAPGAQARPLARKAGSRRRRTRVDN